MSRLPRSFIWFAVTAILFVLQWIPWTGVFLMIVAAPFWSVVTINAGFVSLAVEAAVGRISRIWLLVPFAWFGGYALASQASERALVRLDGEIRAANERQSLAFYPIRSVLAVQENADDLGDAARTLVQRYTLPVVYTVRAFERQARRANELANPLPSSVAYRLGEAALCAFIAKEPRAREANIQGSPPRRRKAGEKAASCVYSIPEEPALPATTVSAKSEPLGSWLLTGKRTRITVTSPDGQRLELITGRAEPLSRWPMPAMGCALNSGRPSWDCFAGFVRGEAKGLGGSGAYGGAAIEVVARALGLEERQATESGDADRAAIERALARHEAATLENLDRLLRDPTLRASTFDFAGLALRPELLSPRADALLHAMSAALGPRSGDSETARNVQRLIAALPDADFQRVGADLVRRLEAGRPGASSEARKPKQERIDRELAVRLGDLGPPALPILERLAFAPRGESAAFATLGLCRMGGPAAHLAVRLAEHIAATSDARSDNRAAGYVTLTRWGRADLAETLVDPDPASREGRYQRAHYPRRWPGLSASSGAEVCTLRVAN